MKKTLLSLLFILAVFIVKPQAALAKGTLTVPLTVKITIDKDKLRIGETAEVTFTFSEAITGLGLNDFTVNNGSLSDFSTNGNMVWTATLTPRASVESATNVIIVNLAGFTDMAGNPGIGSVTSSNYSIDTERPTVTIKVPDDKLVAGEKTIVTFTFTEAVTEFDNTDIKVESGTLSSVGSVDGRNWMATFTPTPGIKAETNVITLKMDGVFDMAGNSGFGTISSNNYTVETAPPADHKPPTVLFFETADDALRIGQTTTLRIVFNEVVEGITIANFAVQNGYLTDLSSTNGGVEWTATVTPNNGVEVIRNLLSINLTGITDLAGNSGTLRVSSNLYSIDTKRPTVEIKVDKDRLRIGETATVTFTFSEAIDGFDNDDIEVANGSLSPVSSTDGGITWTATFIPTDGITAATNAITVQLNGITDPVGNGGVGSVPSDNYSIDTSAPNVPAALAAISGDTENVLNWAANTEKDLLKYVLFAGTSPAPTTILKEIPSGTTTYTHTGLNNGTTYYYRIQAIDELGNSSALSAAVLATPNGAQTIAFANIPVQTYGAAAFTLGDANSSAGLVVTYIAADPSVVAIAGNKATILKVGSTLIRASQAGNAGVKAAADVEQTLTVNPALLTITAVDQVKFVGAANPELTLRYAGFVNGEGSSVLTTLPGITTTANLTSPIGEYDIIVSNAAAINYRFKYENGTLTVKPGAPTDITLAAVTLYENRAAGAKAGTLSSTSEDPDATFSYSLLDMPGSTDASLFTIVDNELRTSASLDFEGKSTYQLRVKSTIQHGQSLEKVLTINVSDVNETPTLAVINDQNICYTTTTQSIALNGISAGPEAAQNISLTASSNKPAMFEVLSVKGNGATGTISYKVKAGALAGTATVTVTAKDNGGTANGGIDTYSRTFTITVNALPIVEIKSDKGTQVSKGETVLLTATGGGTYEWTDARGVVAGKNTAVLEVRPNEHTTYTVTVTNSGGCIETKSITINVLEDFAKIKATNILTPNNDGYNDKWVIDNIDFYPNNEVKVFDKGGRIVYSKRGYDNSWDGSFNDGALAEDTYYYIIDFGTSRPKFKGFITIVRQN